MPQPSTPYCSGTAHACPDRACHLAPTACAAVHAASSTPETTPGSQHNAQATLAIGGHATLLSVIVWTCS
eukprot:349928-Chlamydomonas_euryale.AAC.4